MLNVETKDQELKSATFKNASKKNEKGLKNNNHHVHFKSNMKSGGSQKIIKSEI